MHVPNHESIYAPDSHGGNEVKTKPKPSRRENETEVCLRVSVLKLGHHFIKAVVGTARSDGRQPNHTRLHKAVLWRPLNRFHSLDFARCFQVVFAEKEENDRQRYRD